MLRNRHDMKEGQKYWPWMVLSRDEAGDEKNKERCSGWCLNQRHNWSKYWEWVTVEYWVLNEVSVPHSPMPKKHQKEVTGRFGEPEDDRTTVSIVFWIWHGVHNQDHTTVLATWHLHTETYITWKWEEDYKRACCIIIKWQQIEHICENFKNKRGEMFLISYETN